jgi:hypothetical protein
MKLGCFQRVVAGFVVIILFCFWWLAGWRWHSGVFTHWRRSFAGLGRVTGHFSERMGDDVWILNPGIPRGWRLRMNEPDRLSIFRFEASACSLPAALVALVFNRT